MGDYQGAGTATRSLTLTLKKLKMFGSDPIPLPTSPLKGEEPGSLNLQGDAFGSLPFKGRVGVGMGFSEDGVIRIRNNS